MATGEYQLERLVSLAPQQSNPRIDLDYLDLLARRSGSLCPNPCATIWFGVGAAARASRSARAGSVVGLAVLEQGSPPLVRRSALLASIAYRLGLPGARSAEPIWRSTAGCCWPGRGDAHYHYGRFLLASAQYPRAVFYLRNAFAQGILDAELLLGIALLKQGEREEAATYLQRYPDRPIRTILRSSRCCDNQLVTWRGSRQRPAAIPT